MRKEVLIIVGTIIFIIVAHAVSQIYMQRFFESISKDLEKIEQKILDADAEELNNEELERDIESVMNKWKEKYDTFACYIEHDELEKIQVQLISIQANIRVGDYDKSIDEAERCKFILKHIEEKDSLKVVNIF